MPGISATGKQPETASSSRCEPPLRFHPTTTWAHSIVHLYPGQAPEPVGMCGCVCPCLCAYLCVHVCAPCVYACVHMCPCVQMCTFVYVCASVYVPTYVLCACAYVCVDSKRKLSKKVKINDPLHQLNPLPHRVQLGVETLNTSFL